jgi:hypothetical protein
MEVTTEKIYTAKLPNGTVVAKTEDGDLTGFWVHLKDPTEGEDDPQTKLKWQGKTYTDLVAVMDMLLEAGNALYEIKGAIFDGGAIFER